MRKAGKVWLYAHSFYSTYREVLVFINQTEEGR
jgi:hypothetical protein